MLRYRVLGGFMLSGCLHDGAQNRNMLLEFIWIPWVACLNSKPVFDMPSAFFVFVKGD